MKSYKDVIASTVDTEEYLMLSGIQHFVFCSRQWALIHIENQWEENIRTYGGQQMHERADDPFSKESRGNIVISRSLPLVSHGLKMYGIADVVEFHQSELGIELEGKSGLWQVVPVEYKYGQKKQEDCDRAQLCAQAICLEEMFHIEIEKGYLYYGKTRRREEVLLDNHLRNFVMETAREMWKIFLEGKTPCAIKKKNCVNCSLINLCMPDLFIKKSSVKNYLNDAVEEDDSCGSY